jgi:hypothetical protein
MSWFALVVAAVWCVRAVDRERKRQRRIAAELEIRRAGWAWREGPRR